MRCEWDDKKSRANLETHGVSFEDADRVFGKKCVTFADDRREYGEPRFITLGTLAGRVVVVVHTPRAGKNRIISMRKANEHERYIYQERHGEDRCAE